MTPHSTEVEPVIECVKADITEERSDAVVNAANGHLAHGGGVAAAIARAAGPDLRRESAEHPFVEPGQVGVTTGGRLYARFVIHAVGPVWRGGSEGEPALLASAYRCAVLRAAELSCTSLSFPSISTGIFGFPLDLAAPIAIQATAAAQAEHPQVARIRFCLFSDRDLAAYSSALTAARG